MKIVHCKWFPPKGFAAITLFKWLIIREPYQLTSRLMNHEGTHYLQQTEVTLVAFVLTIMGILAGLGWWSLLFLPLYFEWYGIEWLIYYAKYRDSKEAYYDISFEREAYENENNVKYNSERKAFAWIKYL